MASIMDLLSLSHGVLAQEAFLSNDAVADATVGNLDWEIDAIGNASTVAYRTATECGGVRLTTAATADGDGSVLRTFTDGFVVKPGAWFRTRLSYPVELASHNFRVGFDDSVTATSPTVGVWFDSDAGVISCQVDSAANGDNSVSVASHPDLTSGTTLVVAEPVDLEFRCSERANDDGGPDSVKFYINSVEVATVPCLIGDDEEVELKIAHWQDSGAADAVALDIDYVEAWLPRTRIISGA
ncbi:MAG: hypothetical protein WC977_02425 [Anaerovoracaceae bacterium]